MDRTNRLGRGTAILLALACGQATLAADTAPQGPYGAVKQILETSTSTLGEPLRYPVGTPSIRTVVVTLLPGDTTARHHHDTPLFVYILEGEVSVEYDGVGARNFRILATFLEATIPPATTRP